MALLPYMNPVQCELLIAVYVVLWFGQYFSFSSVIAAVVAWFRKA